MSKTNLRYPLSLITDETDYLSISVVQYKGAGFDSTPTQRFRFNTTSTLAQTAAAQGFIKGTIKLPMPINVNDSNSVDWDGTKVDALAAAGLDTLNAALKAAKIEGTEKNIVQAAGDVLSNLKGRALEYYDALTPEARRYIKDRLVANAVNIFNSNVDPADVVSRTTGQVLNPNLELTFKGVQLRQHDFSFKLTPRSLREGEEVKAIINTFKRRMAASTQATGDANAASAGLFIKAPDIFVMEFKKGRNKHPFLFSMKPSALKSMSVNYADGAPYSTYYDGTPVSLELKLSFKEINPVYAEDYGIFDQGVGF